MSVPTLPAPATTAASISEAERAGTRHADPYSEYVSAGGPYWYQNSLTSLPHPIDDVALDFGDDIYDRMTGDAQIAALLNVMKTGIAGDGLTLAPAVPEQHEDHEAAQELADWCTWAIERLEHPIDEVLWDLTDALAYGNRVAELVYEHGIGPTGETQVLLKKIAPKPREMTAFVVDPYNNLVGLVGQIPGETFYVQTGVIVDPGALPNFLSREHFCLLTFRAKNGDPRGQSILRAAYDPWYVKQQIKVEYLKYLAQFASPMMIGFTAETAQQSLVRDADGNLPPSPETAMVNRLATARNSTALAFPHSAEVDIVQSVGNGEAHLLGIDLQNREMAKAITGQTLATDEGKHQTRASSGTHQDVLEAGIKPGKRLVARMLVTDILTRLITMNFGAKALDLMPVPTLGETEQHDFAPMATAIAALMTAGYLHVSQLPLIDVMAGLPVRDLSSDAPGVNPVTGILLPIPAPPAAPAPGDAKDGQPGQPGHAAPPPPPATPIHPEQAAATYISLVAQAAAVKRGADRAASRQRITRLSGAHIRTYLERKPAA